MFKWIVPEIGEVSRQRSSAILATVGALHFGTNPRAITPIMAPNRLVMLIPQDKKNTEKQKFTHVSIISFPFNFRLFLLVPFLHVGFPLHRSIRKKDHAAWHQPTPAVRK